MWATLSSGVKEFVTTVRDDTSTVIQDAMAADGEGAEGESAEQRAVRRWRPVRQHHRS